MTLDERIAVARHRLDTAPTPQPPDVAVLERRLQRQRTRRLITAASVVALAAATVVWGTTRNHDREVLTVDQPATTAPNVPATDQAQGALVTPIPFGNAGLVLVPGLWGMNADISVNGNQLTMSLDGLSAVISDDGPAADKTVAADSVFAAPIDEDPRLGPLGPSIQLDDQADPPVAQATIAGRTVTASGRMNGRALSQILRAVTVLDEPTPTSQVPVPDVVGIDYRDATDRLHAAGLGVRWELVIDESVPMGTTTSTDPGPGADASAVTVYVAGPTPSRRPDGNLFQRVSPIGYADTLAGPSTPEAAQALSGVPTLTPVVFLHGELVGMLPSGGALALPGSAERLSDLTNPAWRPEVTPPATTQPLPPLTQTVSFRDVSLRVPADWAVVSDTCPAANTAVTGSVPASCDRSVPGPWLALEPAPDVRTPCFPGGLNNFTVCWTNNLTDGRTDTLIFNHTGVALTTVEGGLGVINAIRDTLAMPDTGPSTGGPDPDRAIDAVRYIVGGDCDQLRPLLSGNLADSICDPNDERSTPGRGDYSVDITRPRNDPDDLTRNAMVVKTTRPSADPAWFVEQRTYYLPDKQAPEALIESVEGPGASPIVTPATTTSDIQLIDATAGCGPTDGPWINVTVTATQERQVYAQLWIGDQPYGKSEPHSPVPGFPAKFGFDPLTLGIQPGTVGQVHIISVNDGTTLATKTITLDPQPGVACG